ncbi:hypothetical protein Pst134EA_027747 [Puccinia striiformis f. sp. tritici]|uniref:Uncharacterized protein n=1 Tax=Puccinia striiformis f. sp. tritici PST-78 TaxID=1165861 RepID=A0A0L0URA2_9BASI|nr:hypothetical protein Pst134EA_027747 [Puccinia striiformis f. sp. tritici]KAH9448437.1 hypothetical protein Pst134EA_027747 [Puccinia striiformis f. sp. tritici]KNE89446.1 hypothetical protein PSTG_17099 [Puccinia striiformis f. sp. tritici PST-78]
MERSDPHGSPLAKKRPANQRKFAKEVYKPSNRLLPPNKRLWGSENVNDVSEDTASSKEIQQASKQAPALKKGKSKVKEESESKAKEKPGRKIASKPVKLSDKSNAQKEVVTRTSGRVTRSSVMTNSRAGQSKIDVLDKEEEVIRGPKKVREEKGLVEDEEEHDNFLDVSADHQIHPFFRTNQPTQQSLGADVTLTFDVDCHARALAGCSPIPRNEAVEDRNTTNAGGSNPTRQVVQHSPSPPPPTRGVKNTRAKLKSSQPPSEPSPPKKRARRQPTTTKASKPKASKAPLSDDPLMI